MSADLIAKLEARLDFDFHADRQMADEFLIACGWSVQQDPAFEGGFCWSVGKNPTYCTGERTRPHPILDIDSALAHARDFADTVRLRIEKDGTYVALSWVSGMVAAWFPDKPPTVALMICALKAKAMGGRRS